MKGKKLKKFMYIFFIITIFMVLYCISLNTSKAEEDFMIITNGRYRENEKEDFTNTVFVGEKHNLQLYYMLGHNCTRWSILILDNGLIADKLDGFMQEGSAGRKAFTNLHIKSNAQSGEYNITMKLNYTDEDGNYVEKYFYSIIYLFKSLEIKKITIPTISDMLFKIEFEIFLNFSKIVIQFDTDGSLSSENKTMELYDLSIGNYTVETIIRDDIKERNDQDEVGYEIDAYYDESHIRFVKKNIMVDSLKNKNNNDEEFSIVVYLLLVILLILISLIFTTNIWYPTKK